MMRAAVIVFPGTNCDRDTKMACEGAGWETDHVWHSERSLKKYDAVILPGGFSYGDYIRSGRLAKFSPVMDAVKRYVKEERGVVLGICNGFQILCESGLLPGVLTDNMNARFICKNVSLGMNGSEITLPIAHGEGRYICDNVPEDMIFLTYKDNPNGSVKDIAGLYDRDKRIIGMMPHPERAFFRETGNTDGRRIFEMIGKAVRS